MTPRDWDAATYERLAAPITAMGAEVLDRLVLRRRRDRARRRLGTGNVRGCCSSGCRAGA